MSRAWKDGRVLPVEPWVQVGSTTGRKGQQGRRGRVLGCHHRDRVDGQCAPATCPGRRDRTTVRCHRSRGHSLVPRYHSGFELLKGRGSVS